MGFSASRALGIWSALGGGGAALGMLLGGLLTAGPGWSWVFFVNVPVGVLLALSLQRVLPADAAGRSPGRLDLGGAALVTGATGTLIYVLIQVGDRGWTSAATGVLAATAAGLYLAFVARVRRAAHPLMDLGLLLRRPVAVGTLLVLVATALMITVFFLGSFYFQRHQGYHALLTGLLFLPVALATMAGATIAGRVLARTDPRLLGRPGWSSAGSAWGSRPPPTAPRPGRGGRCRRRRDRRRVRRRLRHRFEPTWVVLAGAVALGVDGLRRGAVRPGYGLPLQTLALLGFGAAASAALVVDPQLGAYLVAAGLLGHAAWDAYHHRVNRVVVRSMAEFCLVLATALAAAIVLVTMLQ